MIDEKDLYYMRKALEEAEKAKSTLEVPVGAILVYGDKIVGRGYNQIESSKDPTCHAEILALRQASKSLGGWRLKGTTMYVTLEPCPMCAGAILNARVDRLVIGARDIKSGACGSVVNLFEKGSFNHSLDLSFGVLEGESSEILKSFFRDLRKRKINRL